MDFSTLKGLYLNSRRSKTYGIKCPAGHDPEGVVQRT